MASTATTTTILGSATSATRPSSASNPTSKRTSVVALPTRRQALTMVVGTGFAGWWRMEPAKAENIPLFGIRKKLEKVEEAVEKEAEKVVEAAESEIRMAEEDLQMVVEGGGRTADLWQAGAVVGAEVVGVVIATSVVNGILGPES
ncbi:uncharacterized protein LOC116253539 [Nymphaea colorata]|uniref:Uncharacterized protein n=1 Tax=Nymphaea colorata TaxID=210225 RepID=A0A5K1CWS6_9MAGN|nr:uncharacterized protein LOC116253539 [Nymphaea colorata]